MEAKTLQVHKKKHLLSTASAFVKLSQSNNNQKNRPNDIDGHYREHIEGTQKERKTDENNRERHYFMMRTMAHICMIHVIHTYK